MTGNWTITITGKGNHHGGKPKDADAIALAFVQKLLASDQKVIAAVFSQDGCDDLAAAAKAAPAT